MHGDFHHHNILRSARGPLAIDPKPMLGEPEYDVPSYLWNPLFYRMRRDVTERRLAAFAAAGLDEERMRIWGVIRGAYLGADEDESAVLRGARLALEVAAELLPEVLHRRRSRGIQRVVRHVVDGAHDPAVVAEVEHVDARRRLLEGAEVRPIPREGVGDDDPVDAAVEDGERGVPFARHEAIERRMNPVERFAERLAPEKAGTLVGDAERADEERFELLGREGVEPAAAPLRELGPALDLVPGATIAAVSAVRGRSLVTTRSSSTPSSASRAASACSRPRFVSGTCSGLTGRPVSSTYETSAWRIR